MSGHSHTPAQQSVHSHELHAHKAGDAIHSHAKEITSQKVLTIALVITLGFAVVEVFAGIYANSLALISDAGHMVTDAAGLLLAVIAQFISKRPPSAKYSFGLGRAEALAAFVNSLAMIVLVISHPPQSTPQCACGHVAGLPASASVQAYQYQQAPAQCTAPVFVRLSKRHTLPVLFW